MDERKLPDEKQDNPPPASGQESDHDHDHDHDYDRVPGEWEVEGPAVSISLGDATDLDPALLAAICGPDGLGGQSLSALYGQTRRRTCCAPPRCSRR